MLRRVNSHLRASQVHLESLVHRSSTCSQSSWVCFSTGPLNNAANRGFVEIREYTLKPGGIKEFLRTSEEHADLRKQLLPFKGMFTCDTGGRLNRVLHFYTYQDFDQRDGARQAASKHPAWQKYIDMTRPHVEQQDSRIMMEALDVYAAVGMPPCRDFFSPPRPQEGLPVYEMRSYQLKPGHGSVPTLMRHFKEGLADKIAAYPDGKLVFLGYTQVGMLNQVMELWRYPSAQDCIRAREAARSVRSWMDVMASIIPLVDHFESSFLHPTKFSPWQ